MFRSRSCLEFHRHPSGITRRPIASLTLSGEENTAQGSKKTPREAACACAGVVMTSILGTEGCKEGDKRTPGSSSAFVAHSAVLSSLSLPAGQLLPAHASNPALRRTAVPHSRASPPRRRFHVLGDTTLIPTTSKDACLRQVLASPGEGRRGGRVLSAKSPEASTATCLATETIGLLKRKRASPALSHSSRPGSTE